MLVVEGASTGAQNADAIRDRVRQLVRFSCLGLGSPRRRRFWYQPPPKGWAGIASGLYTRWLAPGYPRQDAMIVVHPAKPIGENPWTFVIDRLMHEDADWEDNPKDGPSRKEIKSMEGPEGYRWEQTVVAGDRKLFRDTALLTDGVYTYGLRLSADPAIAAKHQPVFHRMVESIRILPQPESIDIHAESMIHWTD
jgi:hypothetical protein